MQRILLVEDNEMNRDLISRRLKRRGFEVLMATDGAAGVEAATREIPDLILMDIGLPLLDGYEATRLIKENQETSLVPVIGLSAHAMSGDADKALEAGCDDYDTKPIEWPRLLAKIQKLLEWAAEAKVAAAIASGAYIPASPGTGVRLLVVMDSAMRTEMLTTRLSAIGHTHQVVRGVAAAIERLADRPFDAVLLDISVPGVDGTPALESLRAVAGEGVPILMLCAIDAIQEAIDCLERGAAEIVPQPFRVEELRHRLETQLELAQKRREQASGDCLTDRRRVEYLMRSQLPESWIEELKQSRKLPPRRIEEVTLMQWDLPSLNQQIALSSLAPMTPLQKAVVSGEELAQQHGGQIVTIDNRGVLLLFEVGGQEASVRAAVRCGLDLAAHAIQGGESFRAAVHTGPVLVGVLGHQNWRFGVWGSTVTVVQQACRSAALAVNVTEPALALLGDGTCGEVSGEVAVEGGALTLYRVDDLS